MKLGEMQLNMVDFAERYARIICYGAGEWAVRAGGLLRVANMEPDIYCVTHLNVQHISEDFLGMSFDDAAKDILGSLNVPLLLNADLGHLPPMMPIVSGAAAKVDACDGKMKLQTLFI